MRRIDRHNIGSKVGSYFKGNPESGVRSNARTDYIESVRVYGSGHQGRQVSIYIETLDGKALPIIELSPAAALAVAKAIIETLPDITVAADEGLVGMVADKTKRVADEAAAVNESIKTEEFRR